MTSDLLLTDLTLATLAEEGGDPYGLIEDAVVEIKDGLFGYVGPADTFTGDSRGRLSMEGHLALPGFVACHNQLLWAPAEPPAAPQSADERRALVAGVAAATTAAQDAALLASARTRLARLARAGMTSCELKSGFGQTPAQELRLAALLRRLQEDLPYSTTLTLYLGHFIPEFADPDEHLQEIERTLLPRIYAEGACDSVEAFCDDDAALDLDQASALLELFYRRKLPTRVSCDRFTDAAGATLPASFYSKAATFLCCSDDIEIQTLASVGTTIVLVPEVALRDSDSSMPDIQSMRSAGARLAVSCETGPDGTGLDLLGAARLAVTTYGLTPAEALRGITCNAAAALGMGDCAGQLVEGHKADLAFFDAGHPAELLAGRLPICWGTFCSGRPFRFGETGSTAGDGVVGD